MAHNTRSQSSRASSECGELSQTELEQINKKLTDKEKLIQEQAQALKLRQIELDKREANINKEKNAAVGIDGLSAILNSLRQEIVSLKALPQQVEQLSNKVNDLSNTQPLPPEPMVVEQHPDSPQHRIPPRIPANEPYINRDSPVHSLHSPPDYTSPIRFKDIVDSIPRYDGHKLPVFQFCKICERATKLIPPSQEPYLVQLIITKLHGHAYTAVEGMNFPTVASLTFHLKKIFGPNKSLNQYRGELGNLYMLPNEDIFTYIERTKELRSAIIDGETNLYGTLLSQDEDRIDQDVLESFINGLPTDLLVRVKIEGQYGSLDGAIASTIQLSKTLEAEARRKKHTFPVKNSAPRVDFPTRTPIDRKYEPFSRPSYPTPSNVPFVKPLVPGQLGPNVPNEKFCKYCKHPGHLINECRKLAYRQSFINPPGTAGYKPGNATSVPDIHGVRRDASQIGRQIEPKTVRFQETLPPDLPSNK